ncbi:hypothetical protein [Burkholderia pseudomallei]|uniref:hypothetical protein n=1 Tax=Burkholderia pseudomallei TaxID=28450 RepID=UPI000F08FA90|nr:hypothetical protein [Burkholderia pseudomallei]VBD52263.1 putative bacteriophage protein [Burkholderia pseudomallei]VBE82921.1 putative bacteriophage protein [Burkholderia pseudomallei]
MLNDNVLTNERRMQIVDEVCEAPSLNYWKFGDKRVLMLCRAIEREVLSAHPEPVTAQPNAAVTDGVLVPKRVIELLGIINREGIIKRASELQEVYRLVDAARTQGSQS